ncbi:MAG: outer membrane beta-barrel protein [Pseudomonadota bacterium]
MIKKNIIAAAVMLAGLTLAAGASAQVYLGAAIGQSRWDASCAGATACKTSDTSYKFIGGYDFTRIFGIESSYFSLGELSASNATTVSEMRAKGFEFSGVVRTPRFVGLSGFAKLGVAAIKGETNSTTGSVSSVASKSSAQAVYGLGMTYLFTEKTNLRVEIERRKIKVSDIGNASANATNFSVGVQASY